MKSPFKFLDAYTFQDQDIFFGRDQEVETLYNLTYQAHILMIYGQSGTGKTSLIQGGLAARYDGPDWRPFFIRRQDNINTSLQKALQQSISDQNDPGDNIVEFISLIFRTFLSPVYLIFDQFEEVLILGDEAEKKEFANTLQAIIQANLNCKILLVIREEYIASLYEFERVIPSLFDYRLRLEPMNRVKMKEVIQSSFAKFNISLEPPEEESLALIMDNLSSGQSNIALPYTQVYLDLLYRETYLRTYLDRSKEQVNEYPPLTLTQASIKDFGQIEGILERFLSEQNNAVQFELRKVYPDFPDRGVQQILDIFVTMEGTRRPLSYARSGDHITISDSIRELLPGISDEALSDCLTLLERNRLLRFSDDFIELAQNSLAALIDQQRTDEQRQLNEIRRRITLLYHEFQQTGSYLTQAQLLAFGDWLPKLSLEPALLQFVEESALQAKQEENQLNKVLGMERFALERRSRIRSFWGGILSFFLLLMLFISIWAVRKSSASEQKMLQMQDNLYIKILQQAQLYHAKGKYTEAIAQLKLINNYVQDAPKRQHLDSLTSQWTRLSELIAHADSLAQSAKKWTPALEKYEKAYQISPDDSILVRINELKEKIRLENKK